MGRQRQFWGLDDVPWDYGCLCSCGASGRGRPCVSLLQETGCLFASSGLIEKACFSGAAAGGGQAAETENRLTSPTLPWEKRIITAQGRCFAEFFCETKQNAHISSCPAQKADRSGT